MNKDKISVIGAGAVGTACALELARKELGKIVLLDTVEGLAQGKALDLSQAGPISGYGGEVSGSTRWEETESSRIVIITAGRPRQPGMSRSDLLATNAGIVKSVVSAVARYSPEAILILVTNPLDVMCYLALKESKFSPRRVLGQSGILDSARLRFFLGRALGIPSREIEALVLGGHGDRMLALTRLATAGGVPVQQLLPPEKLKEIVDRTRRGGAEIVGHLKRGGAFLAPGAAAALMAEGIVRDRKWLLPCSTYLEGEYGLSGVFMGVPVVLGADGREEIVEVELAEGEAAAFRQSAEAVRTGIKILKQDLKLI